MDINFTATYRAKIILAPATELGECLRAFSHLAPIAESSHFSPRRSERHHHRQLQRCREAHRRLVIGPARFRQRSGIQFVHPQASVNRGSFPRIFGLPVHAYLVYIHGFSTHIWSTFTHKLSTKRSHLTDIEMDALSPIYLYENPIWIACSSSAHRGNRRGQRTADRQEPPPPREGKAPAALSG